MEVCFLASGERLTVLDPQDFEGRTAMAVKQRLAAPAGVSRFRQRLFPENDSCEIEDDEVFAGAMKVMLVVLELGSPGAGQTQQLVDASMGNNLVSLEALLRQPCDPNVVDEEGVTPLHYAAERGHLQALQLLLEAGADKDAMVAPGAFSFPSTPLFWAAADNHVDIVRFLLAAGANKDLSNPLYIAAQNGNFESVHLLVASGVTIDQAEDNGETPLMTAASEGYLKIVELLVASGARCDITREDGYTAMDCATTMSNVEMVRFLAEPTVRHLAELETDKKRLKKWHEMKPQSQWPAEFRDAAQASLKLWNRPCKMVEKNLWSVTHFYIPNYFHASRESGVLVFPHANDKEQLRPGEELIAATAAKVSFNLAPARRKLPLHLHWGWVWQCNTRTKMTRLSNTN